jgi:adenosylcobinamide amidohydrolase
VTVRAGATAQLARVHRSGPWLVVRFASTHDVASWAIVGGGITRTRTVAWRHAVERELRPPVDAAQWLRVQMHAEGLEGAVGLITSRHLDAWVEAGGEAGGARAHCVATVGLDNALRAGDPPGPFAPVGTINVLCSVDIPLASTALLEGLAIATEAKAAALFDAGVASRRTGLLATGTGTDCVVMASPNGPDPTGYAGKHTDVGAAIGVAVREAVSAGTLAWIAQKRGS